MEESIKPVTSDLAQMQRSCSPKLSRTQFLDRLIKKAVVAGTLAVVPSISDSFIAPARAAVASGAPPPAGGNGGSGGNGGAGGGGPIGTPGQGGNG